MSTTDENPNHSPSGEPAEAMEDSSQSTTSQQNTIGPGAAQGAEPEMVQKQSSTTTFTKKKKYTKTFWHYVSNNPDRRGVHIYVNTQGFPSINVDFGGQYVPYDNCRT